MYKITYVYPKTITQGYLLVPVIDPGEEWCRIINKFENFGNRDIINFEVMSPAGKKAYYEVGAMSKVTYLPYMDERYRYLRVSYIEPGMFINLDEAKMAQNNKTAQALNGSWSEVVSSEIPDHGEIARRTIVLSNGEEVTLGIHSFLCVIV